MPTRLRVFSIFIFIGFTVVIARLFYWQIYKGKELSIAARNQYKSGYEISASRGEILASDGTWLAASGQTWLIYAALPDISDKPDKIAEKLAPLFVSDTEKDIQITEIQRVRSLLEKKGVVWIPLKSRVDDETKKKIEDFDIKGIGFEVEESRVYPEGSSAAHLLGFVGKNKDGANEGYFGLEGYYDVALSGKPGFLQRDSDATGNPIVLGESREISAISGVDFVTNIDKRVQLTLEKKLAEGIEKYGASSGTGVVMNPQSGAVIAMSSFPSYEPGKYWEYGDKYFNNPAIFSSFEPGSVFKVVVMASALDAKVVEPETECDICSGPVKIDKYVIETWNKEYYPNSRMTDVIVHSDNVGMVFVSEKLGKEKMYDYLTKFGFGKISGIDLQGEITPKLRDKDKWGVVELATASFGQGVAVTPIQMTAAVSAIANKGMYIAPQVVKKIVSESWEQDIKVGKEVRIISEKAASQITGMMVEAAKKGESKWTYTRGFRVAGKTGTAQIPIAGHYDEEKTIASFVGFAPSDKPKFVMLITLQEPVSSPWASETAAPLWYSIANDLFPYFGIQPEN